MAVPAQQQGIVHAVETAGHITHRQKTRNRAVVLIQNTHLCIDQQPAEDVEECRTPFERIIRRRVNAGQQIGPLAVIRVIPKLIELVVSFNGLDEVLGGDVNLLARSSMVSQRTQSPFLM